MSNFAYLVQVTPENVSLLPETFKDTKEQIVFVYDAVHEDIFEEVYRSFACDDHLINDKNREGIVYNLNRGLRYIHKLGLDVKIVIPGVFNAADDDNDNLCDVDFNYNSWNIRKSVMDKNGYLDGVLRDKFFLLDYYGRAKSAGFTTSMYSGILSKECEGEESLNSLSFSAVIFGTKWSIMQGVMPSDFGNWIDEHNYTFHEDMVIK